jgi:putative membrane protein
MSASTIMWFAAGLAGATHVLFFLLESILWGRPATNRIFGQTPEKAEITRLLAFNQGFYNLFLAIGVFIGIVIGNRGMPAIGSAITAFGCATMLGAALVLIGSSRKLWRGALIQGLPPLVFLALFARMVL